MALSGGCYCQDLGCISLVDVTDSIEYHCREYIYFTGENPNNSIIVPREKFKFTQGTPKSYERTDIENPMIRLFCQTCGTIIGTKSPKRLGSINLKVGTLDDPSIFKPQSAIFTNDRQEFHYISGQVEQYKKRP